MKRLRDLLLAALFAAWLGGCGPGVGGTGTGEAGEFLADFGAVAQPLCAAPFAARLDCDGVVRPGEPAPGSGTLPVAYLDAAGGVQVVFAGHGVALDAPCLAIEFDGVWGVAAGGDPGFFGGLLEPGSTEREPAQLVVGTVAGSAGELTVVLRAADGRVLLGPLALRPAAQPLPAMVCP